MKPIIFSVWLLVLWSYGATAQVVINPKAGLHITDLRASDGQIEIDGRNGFQFGADFRIGNRNLFFNPGIHYFSNRFEVDVIGLMTDGDSRVQQLRVPLAFGLRLSPRENMFALRAKAGVVSSLLLGVDESETLQLERDDVRPYRAEGMVGLGLDVALLITIDVQYAFGLQDYLDNGDGSEGYLVISAGVKFGRGNALYGR